MKMKYLLWLVSCIYWITPIYAEEIINYDIKITVLQSGKIHISEKIDYDFAAKKKHGIYRDIPKTVKIDGHSWPKETGLSVISVKVDGQNNSIWKTESIRKRESGEMLRIKIGDPDKTISGIHSYKIEYIVKKGVMPAEKSGMDAIRWNAVGTGWDIGIRNIEVDLYLPAKLNIYNTEVYTYTGKYGSRGNKASNPDWIDEHHFHITAKDFAPHEGLTVEILYPLALLDQIGSENFKSQPSEVLLTRWPAVITILFFLFVRHIAGTLGSRQNIVSDSTRYYPPSGLSLLQSGLLYDKFADNRDLSAAILELGQLGYLEIYNDKKSSNPFVKKIEKDRSGLTRDQLYILDSLLFANSNIFVFGKSSQSKATRVNDALNTISDLLYSWSVTEGYMKENPKESRFALLVYTSVPALLITAYSFYATFKVIGAEGAIVSIMGAVFFSIGASLLMHSWNNKRYLAIFFALIWTLISIMHFGAFIKNLSLQEIMIMPFFFIPVLGAIIWYYYRKTGIYTQKGIDLYRYLKGYSRFMAKVEKDRIKRFLKEDPEYLDRGLPYALLFGHNKHWLEFYSTLEVQSPQWYFGDLNRMGNFSESVASQSISPESGSTGGFSGGGSFSGGGGGGGGGGSW